MSIFQTLIANALQYAQENDVALEDFGTSASMLYVRVRGSNTRSMGVTLVPHTEGELSGLQGDSIETIFSHAASYNPMQRALCLALINALGQHSLHGDASFTYATRGTRALLLENILERTRQGDEVVFVGNLAPVVAALKENGRKPIVFCRQKNQYAQGIYSDIFEYEAIQKAPIAIITGASLIGSTLDALMHLSPKNTCRILAGFSAGAHPSWFEGTGVSHVASMKIEERYKEALIKNHWDEIFDYPAYFAPVLR